MRSRSPVTWLQGNTEILRRIKAVVLDLDGTLLRSDRTISERTRLALDGVRELGLEIIIATARPPRAVAGMVPKEIVKANYIVYYNGALIANSKTGYFEHRALDTEIVAHILAEFGSLLADSCLTFEIKDRWVCLPSLSISDRAMLQAKYGEIPETVELQELLKSPILKMLWHHRAHVAHLPGLFSDRASVMVTDGGTLVQMSARQATKASAVAKVLEAMRVNPADAAVFGDDTNDLGLFGLCGFPVAMGNAIPELKAVAQLVTHGNDQDGVAIVLEEILNAREYL
jgi:Cof subfamily protein (haloacid dehalogenase superfamily)